MSKTFEQMLDELKIPYTCNMIEQFHQYYEILIEWNKVMNLTGITEYEDVVIKHFVDSVSIKKAVRMENINTIIDIGTGAGFPGIPIKIVYPHIHVCLLDSLNKRIQFLNNVIETLGLKNIETIHGRAEDYAKQKQYREKYDLCVSRAVANLSSLSEYCLPYTWRKYKKNREICLTKNRNQTLLSSNRKRKENRKEISQKSRNANKGASLIT